MFSDIIDEKEKIYRDFVKKNRKEIVDYSFGEISEEDLISLLLNPDVDLELLARRSKEITDKFFGKAILLYAPLYIADYCVNGCVYCGFCAKNKIPRERLDFDEIDEELRALKALNIDSVVLLTGEDRLKSSVEYIGRAVEIARKYFSEVLVEVYPLERDEYAYLVDKGLTGVTLYQETYDRVLYKKLHPFGPKRNYKYRLDAIERAVKANVKEVNVGPLIGLNPDFNFEVYITNAHAKYIQDRYSDVEVSVSFPRIQSALSKAKSYVMDDKTYVKTITLTRIFLPRVGINVSTRETPLMRDNLIGLGITKMSAGSKTSVGGYVKKSGDDTYAHKNSQFDINDERSVDEVVRLLEKKGYRPEFTNWVRI
jgi:2-iminoacetate synthase